MVVDDNVYGDAREKSINSKFTYYRPDGLLGLQ